MRTGLLLSFLSVTALFATQESAAKQNVTHDGPTRFALRLCFLKGEQTSGLNKICIYECPTGDAAITVKSWELCPQSIDQ